MGRDLWFMLLTNYSTGGSSGKYYALYVTSPNTTTVHVQLSGGLSRTIQVQPFKSAVFNIPLAWETSSAGRVEDMGIHVWSNDADICCYVMSHNPYTSDGFYVYPLIGWGTEYVVAGYAALFEGFGSYVYDLPSEFGVVANSDQTRVTITPTQDLRFEVANGTNCSAIFANRGVPTQVTLQRGQNIQCKSTCTQNCDDYDLTGTVITSNNPVGVICGSQCPNIPCDFPYCDHVCEQVPPVRMWANTYYTVPFFQPPSMPPSHSASTFLVIGTKKGQKIYRFDASAQQNTLYCVVGKYEPYWRNDIAEGSRWSSDAPFLLVQYINSASYPDNYNGNGDPAEVVVPPVEQFTKKAVFQLPISIGNQNPYTNYVNIIANENDKNVLLDGKPVGLATRVYIDGKYTGYRVTGLKTGGHIVESDSGAGIYIYGYGYDESFGWTGNFANSTFNSPDTIPPVPDTTGVCYDAHVSIVDTMFGVAFPPPATGIESGLFFTTVDSQVNMAYILDPNWSEGKQQQKSFYDMYVLDHSKPAILIVSYYDQAGNKTTVTSTYRPELALLSPPLTDFGIGNATNCTIMYDTLTNLGETGFKYKTLKLLFGDKGFSLDTSYSSNSLGIGEKRLIRICFKSLTGASAVDTLVMDDGCDVQKVVLIGTGGQPDFYVTGYDFGPNILNSTSAPSKNVVARNTSATQPISYDSMYVEDPVHFKPNPTGWISDPSKTFSAAAKSDYPVEFNFVTTSTDTNGPYQTKWWTHSPTITNSTTGENGWRSAILRATVVSPAISIGTDQEVTVECVNASNATVELQYEIAASGTATSNIVKIEHTNATDFTTFTAWLQNGNQITPLDPMNSVLQQGSKIFVKESITLPMYVNQDFVDQITAYYRDPSDGVVKQVPGSPVKGTVHAVYRSGQVTADGVVGGSTITFPPVAYKSGKISKIITFTDTTTQPMNIQDITLESPSSWPTSFTSSTYPAMPATLQPGQTLYDTITFDPSQSYDENQHMLFTIKTGPEICNGWSVTANAVVTVKGAALTGFTPGEFSTCENPVANITVHNVKPSTPNDVADTIISAKFESTQQEMSGTNYSWQNGTPVGSVIHGQGTLDIPVMFNPTQASGRNTYCDSVTFIVHNARSLESYDTIGQRFCNTAVSVALTATAGNGTLKIDQGFSLPLSLSQNKNGLTEDISNRNISRVKMTIMLNTDLLDMNSDLTKAFGSTNNWTVDPAGSSLTVAKSPALSTLVLSLIPPNGKLTDANLANVGNLNFHVVLTADSDHTPIQLTSTELIDDKGNTVSGCVTAASISGDFNAQLLCGDSTMRKVMNGAKEIDFVRPATPDPVVGNTVTISYANRGEAELTLAIFDALGKEVSRPIDHVRQGAGAWQVPCDVSHLASGTYTYRLSEDRHVISKQFVIQR